MTCVFGLCVSLSVRLFPYIVNKSITSTVLDQYALTDGQMLYHTGKTALHKACESGHTHVVEALITAGRADVLAATADDGSTALHFASFYGHADVVQLLLRRHTRPADMMAATLTRGASFGNHYFPPNTTAEDLARKQKHTQTLEVFEAKRREEAEKEAARCAKEAAHAAATEAALVERGNRVTVCASAQVKLDEEVLAMRRRMLTVRLVRHWRVFLTYGLHHTVHTSYTCIYTMTTYSKILTTTIPITIFLIHTVTIRRITHTSLWP